MVLGIPSIHTIKISLRLFNHSLKGVEFFKSEIGDDGSHFNDDLFFHIKACHFHVDPEKLVHRSNVLF
ncbi:hypothetical protein D3C87_1764650 [compost metagenome]